MNKILTICAIAASVALVASCSSSRRAAAIADLNGEWAIAAIDGKPVTSPARRETAFLGFNTTTGQLYGNASCNMLTGSFDTKAAPGVIEFTNMGSTRMMCPDMSLEQSVMSALQQVASYAIDRKSGDIELRGDSGKTLILLKKRDPAILASNLHGEWTVSKLNDQPTDSMPGAPYVLTFDTGDNSFSCTTDCNGLAGSFVVAGNGLTFGDVLSTRMACPDMQVEAAISRLLPRVTSFGRLADGSLGLYDQDNNLILTLRRK
ncbi:MAG: META domain-containing protein [Pseudoflavonifractor sp.]|nr:META domain-containing protein [Pseudoflavonifractor sp.]